MAGTDGPLSPTSPIDFRYAGGGRENEEGGEEGGGGAVTGNWIGISIDLRRNDKMHINADVKQKALLNGARYTTLVNPPPHPATKRDNWKLEIKSGIVAANLEWTTSERGILTTTTSVGGREGGAI